MACKSIGKRNEINIQKEQGIAPLPTVSVFCFCNLIISDNLCLSVNAAAKISNKKEQPHPYHVSSTKTHERITANICFWIQIHHRQISGLWHRACFRRYEVFGELRQTDIIVTAQHQVIYNLNTAAGIDDTDLSERQPMDERDLCL